VVTRRRHAVRHPLGQLLDYALHNPSPCWDCARCFLCLAARSTGSGSEGEALDVFCAGQGTMSCMELGEARSALSQLRRGTVEYCVLALLRDGERYGFELVRELSESAGLVTSEGTIYPLLTRLRKEQLVTTTWQESESGPPRRYYRLTESGHAVLTAFVQEWSRFRDSVDAILNGRQGDARHGH
jgi:PadR family transcriptional regulator